MKHNIVVLISVILASIISLLGFQLIFPYITSNDIDPAGQESEQYSDPDIAAQMPDIGSGSNPGFSLSCSPPPQNQKTSTAGNLDQPSPEEMADNPASASPSEGTSADAPGEGSEADDISDFQPDSSASTETESYRPGIPGDAPESANITVQGDDSSDGLPPEGPEGEGDPERSMMPSPT